jgi:hypothetical protein
MWETMWQKISSAVTICFSLIILNACFFMAAFKPCRGMILFKHIITTDVLKVVPATGMVSSRDYTFLLSVERTRFNKSWLTASNPMKRIGRDITQQF